MNEKKADFNDLINLMATLRSAKGCPWDKEQTHDSLRSNLIEETYEVIDAIDSKDPRHLREELGDLLIQIVFHSQIAREHGQFSIDDVVACIHEKLVRRHPHIFGDLSLTTSKEVLANWEAIKKHKEGKAFFDSIPKNLPSLQYAQKVQEKAARVGFDWPEAADIFAKIKEELTELKDAYQGKNLHEIEDEIGDLIFSMVNLARRSGLDSEQLLRKNIGKFKLRFQKMEKMLEEQGLKPADVELDQLEELWQKSKEEV